MSMNVHSLLQQFSVLSPHHAFGKVADQFAHILLVQEESVITELQQSEHIELSKTEFETVYVQPTGRDPIRIVTCDLTVRVGDHKWTLQTPCKLTRVGQRIIQESKISKEIAEHLFGSTSLKDDAKIERTFCEVPSGAKVYIEAEIHPAHRTIKKIAKQVDRLIREHIHEIAKNDLPGLYAAQKYFAGSNEQVSETLKVAIEYVKTEESCSNLALWLFKYGAKDETNRLIEFLNTATADEQKLFWSQAPAQTQELLSLLEKSGSQVNALYFPRLATESEFVKPRPENFIAKAIAYCPNLQKVSLCFLDTEENAIANCSKLVELNAEEDSISFDSLPPSPNLKRLTFKLSNSSQQFSWTELARKYPKLECLTVSCHGAENVAKDLARVLPRVKRKTIDLITRCSYT